MNSSTAEFNDCVEHQKSAPSPLETQVQQTVDSTSRRTLAGCWFSAFSGIIPY
jgi:hypothetical protein